MSITKNCETLNKQTHTKPQEVLEFKINQPKQTIHFIQPISIEGSWRLRLTSLEVYNSIFNITEQNNKFELYKFPDSESGGLSYEKVRDEIERDMEITDITATDLQDETIGPVIFEQYKKRSIKKNGRVLIYEHFSGLQ